MPEQLGLFGQETEEEAEGQEEQQQEAQPQYARAEDFNQLAGLVRGLAETINSGFNVMAAQRQTRGEPEDDFGDVSDEELEEALNSGTGAAKFRKMVQAEARKLAKTQIDPLRQEGHQAISGVVKQLATQNLPHYKRYSKEIDEYVAQLPASQRINPEAYKVAHDIVVGAHVQDIVNESIEAMKRGTPAPQVGTPGGAGHRSAATSGIRGGQQVAPDQESVEVLAGQGRTADGFAQRLGYDNWADYMQKTAEYN